jgi:hypothetical protein
MAIKNTPYSRMKYFNYYTTGNEPLIENIEFSYPFELNEFRLHLSVSMASIEYFIVRLSSILGSAYDVKILSYSMYAHKDLIYQMDCTYKFLYGDILSVQLSFASGTNTYGLAVLGWEVMG